MIIFFGGAFVLLLPTAMPGDRSFYLVAYVAFIDVAFGVDFDVVIANFGVKP